MCLKKTTVVKEDFRRILIRSSKSHSDDEQLKLKYPENVSKTSKYTWLTFLPYALAFQFTKITNIYFALMMVFFLMPSISPFSIGTVISPFAFIMLVSLLREAIEDIRRHRSDW